MVNGTLNLTWNPTQKSFGPVSISLGTRLTLKNDNNDNNDIIKKKMKRSISYRPRYLLRPNELFKSCFSWYNLSEVSNLG